MSRLTRREAFVGERLHKPLVRPDLVERTEEASDLLTVA
jgi:hypothetical protein